MFVCTTRKWGLSCRLCARRSSRLCRSTTCSTTFTVALRVMQNRAPAPFCPLCCTLFSVGLCGVSMGGEDDDVMFSSAECAAIYYYGYGCLSVLSIPFVQSQSPYLILCVAVAPSSPVASSRPIKETPTLLQPSIYSSPVLTVISFKPLVLVLVSSSPVFYLSLKRFCQLLPSLYFTCLYSIFRLEQKAFIPQLLPPALAMFKGFLGWASPFAFWRLTL